MIDHDAKPGPLKRCQISGSENLNLVIDLGHQPLCDALLSKEQLDQPEKTYPLRLMHCPDSGLAQLDYVVAGDEVYPHDYPYRAGISWPVVEAHREMAKEVLVRFGSQETVVIDIGCNDGTLLKEFAALGYATYGIEPTNVASYARDAGIEVAQMFFTEDLGRSLASAYANARKIVTMTNVFAHMSPLGEVMRGIRALMGNDGVFITESHYLLDVLEKTQFDTIYHEHIRTYSLRALMVLFDQYGMEVFDVERPGRYGGNIRAYAAPNGTQPITARVAALLDLEDQKKLHAPATWARFRERAYARRDAFMEFLYRARRSGQSVVGNSAPGRCATLLNFYGVSPDLMQYLGELPTSLKLGKYLPGAHIPIVSNSRIRERHPDYLVLLAWHYAGPIIDRLRSEGVRSTVVMPLPSFTITPAALA